MKIKNVVLTQLDGVTPAPANEKISGPGDDLTVARVLINACCAPGSPVPAEESAARYELSVRLYKAEVGQTFDVKNELLLKLQADVLRLYAPMISGQCVRIFEGTADTVTVS